MKNPTPDVRTTAFGRELLKITEDAASSERRDMNSLPHVGPKKVVMPKVRRVAESRQGRS